MTDPADDFFPSTGELAGLMRAKDWSTTPLGPPSGWPSSLRTTLRLMLTSRYSMWMGWGPDLAFFYNDAYATQTLGPKHPWALGRPFREVWGEAWEALGSRIEHVLRTGEATWDEGLQLFLMRNGYAEETYHTFSYSPAPGDAPGQIAGLFCVVVEETERVIGDRRLALLRELASSLAQAPTAVDVSAAVARCLSREARDIPFSLTYLFDDEGREARLVSRTGFEGTHPAAPETLGAGASEPWPIAAALATGATQEVALPGSVAWPTGPWDVAPSRALVVPIARQGRARPAGIFIAGANPHRPLDASLRGFVELFVGQLASGLANAGAYEEAHRRAEALAELDRAKTAFFSNVSHEFRTPLTLMLGPTEDALTSPERALRGDDLATVHRNELRLLKLVNALLDFARIEAGRIQASYEPTDLRVLTTDLASTFRSAIARAGLSFDVDCDDLPEPIYVDHDMWEKIVLNLLSNALKFTFEGGLRVELRWRVDHAELTIADTGVGIAPSELPRLFERFHRIEGTRARTHEGSGIGLALVHELVRLHGGAIDVTSEVGRGTSFTVSLPRGHAHLQAERISAARTLATTTSGAAYVEEAMRWMPSPADVGGPSEEVPPKSGGRILVADDNADMRDYITRILGQQWDVEAVADGAEALEAIRRVTPDLVLSDVMMPRLDGFGLLRELRADPRTVTLPVILLSARAGEEATAEGLRAGADDYLVKPFSASSLLVRIEAQLSAARLRATMRRSAEEERERLEMMFRESPAGIAVLRGPSLVVELANPLLLQFWGKDEGIIGKGLTTETPELEAQGFGALLRKVLDTGVPYQGREALARLPGRDGTVQDRYFDFVNVPLPATAERERGIFVHAYDVTDKVLTRRHLEQLREAEQRARQEADAANRLKDEFLATMSHELRTPLNAILGWASLLRRGGDDRAGMDRALETIERNAKAQARLVEDILDVSRIISGKLRLDLRRVDMATIARVAMDVVRPAADAKRVRLLLELPEEGGAHLVGDADRLQQVMWNLLSNAVKFTPADGTVTLRVDRAATMARLVVSDTGHGIAAEHLPIIFERFRQVDSATTRRFGGLGLGLAIVRHLVELHGGAVRAESPGLGRGATFTVELPIRAVHDGPEAAIDVVPAPDKGGGAVPDARVSRRLAGIRVLIVDDDEDARLLLQDSLGRAGASVTAVSSARAALDVLGSRKVDVLVSDIGMPDEDGFSLLKRVRALAADAGGAVPAIAVSAYARNEDVTRARDVGFQHHLSKPADLEALERTVAALAGRVDAPL